MLFLTLVLGATAPSAASAPGFTCVPRPHVELPPPIEDLVPGFVRPPPELEPPPVCPPGEVPAPAPYFGPKGRPMAGRTAGRTPTASPSLLAPPSVETNAFYYNASYQAVTNLGSIGQFTEDQPVLSLTDSHSLAEMSVETADGQQVVELGWTVDRSLNNGDIAPHLFVFHWINGAATCYNACNWAQVSSVRYPGMAVPVTDSPQQLAYLNMSGNWWANYQGEWIGYFPSTEWTSPTFTQSGYLQWFGEVNGTDPPTSQMGNGVFGTSPGSASISGLGFYDLNSNINAGAPAGVAPTNAAYYNYSISGNTLTFGGPGSGPPTCYTCANYPNVCAAEPDSCGGALDCGSPCTFPDTCGGGGVSNVCGCIPTGSCGGFNCGSVPDGCGNTLACGPGCTSPQTCGGDGIANVCGCTATKSCAGLECGTIDDGCGNTVACGTGCTSPQTCGGDGIANVCGCAPTKSCAGLDCGTIDDGCGNTLTCGTGCTSPQTCGGGGANVCGCAPTKSCASLNCGTVEDGCGNTLTCGSCTLPKTCGGGGAPNVCGGNCTPTASCTGLDCGTVDDGCGNTLTCGAGCSSPQTCGGGGVLNVCGQPCKPTKSCAGLNCGTIEDGCGNTIACSTNGCASPYTCGGGGAPNVCGCGPEGCPAPDAGPGDAGEGFVDGGRDGGAGTDAGQTADAGHAADAGREPDAGHTVDGGTTAPSDGGAIAGPDAGETAPVDGGAGGAEDRVVGAGCGCGSTNQADLALGALFVQALLARRRRNRIE